jgi:predicted O-methyltransferase YrrM
MGAKPTVEWLDESHLRCGEVLFAAIWSDDGRDPEWDGSDDFPVWKPPTHLRQFVATLNDFEAPNVVEVGVAHGGSAALITLLTAPQRLVTFDLAESPPPQLTAFVGANGLDGVVHSYFGVDQSDRVRLAEVLDAEFGEQPLDLVVDDASHLYDPTRTTFEVLFPRLRPGGLFIIEDWSWVEAVVAKVAEMFGAPTPEARAQVEHHFLLALADSASDVRPRLEAWLAAGGDDVWREDVERWLSMAPAAVASQTSENADRWGKLPSLGASGHPLARLVLELTVAVASAPEIIAGLTIEKGWIGVRRGPASLDHTTFRLTDLPADWTGLLAP